MCDQVTDSEAVGCIVGAVVQLAPSADTVVRQRLERCEGVEIHVEDEQSRLVITIEAATSREVTQLTERIQNFEGVLHVAPVYQHCEESKHEERQGGEWR